MSNTGINGIFRFVGMAVFAGTLLGGGRWVLSHWLPSQWSEWIGTLLMVMVIVWLSPRVSRWLGVHEVVLPKKEGEHKSGKKDV